MRVLDGRRIPYDAFAYSETERDAAVIAALMGVPAGQVFKTLVVARPAARPLLVMVPADRRLDLKKLARAVGEKKLKLASHREAEALTGLQVGGISALALLDRSFGMVLDASAQGCERIYVSAGRRGLDLKVGVTDLLRVTGARCIDVSGPAE